MNIEDVIGEKILQLDTLYSYVRRPSDKARILGEMIELLKLIGIEVIADEKWHELLTQALAISPYSDIPDLHAKILMELNKIRARIIRECIEADLIKSFKEIPIAIGEDINGLHTD